MVFDRNPELYDRIRPGYPAKLFVEIVKHTGAGPGDRLLEIGCGTGKSTGWFAERGYQITALEKGRNLAEFARKKFANYPNLRVLNTPFEDYESGGETYDIVFAGTSFHWIDREIAYSKSAELLRSGGYLCLFWSNHIITRKTRKQFGALQDAYRNNVPEWAAEYENNGPSADTMRWESELEISGMFERAARKWFRFSVEYSASAYVDLLSTYSSHGALDECVRQELFSEIEVIINNRFGGSIIKEYLTSLFIARKKKTVHQM